MTRIEAVLFDKDGTLFDFGATWVAWAETFLLRACDQDHNRAAQVGRAIGFDLTLGQFATDSIVIAGTPDEVAQALAPHFPAMTSAALVALLNEEAENAPQTEVVPLVAYLDGLRGSGLRLGVVTNDAEAPALAHLDAAGARASFDFIAGSDSGFGAKPEPGALLAFCDRFGLAPEACAMVGDSLHDLHAGRAAGMVTVGVLTGLATAETLAPHADVVLPDISHLPEWLATS